MSKKINTNTRKSTDLSVSEIERKVKALDKEIESAHSKAEAARQRANRSSDEEVKLLARLHNAFWRKRKTRLREEKTDYQNLKEIINSKQG